MNTSCSKASAVSTRFVLWSFFLICTILGMKTSLTSATADDQVPARRAQTSSSQRVVFVVDTTCLEVFKTTSTRFEAPVSNDGTPDLKAGKVLGVGVKFDKNCGRFEIRRGE